MCFLIELNFGILCNIYTQSYWFDIFSILDVNCSNCVCKYTMLFSIRLLVILFPLLKLWSFATVYRMCWEGLHKVCSALDFSFVFFYNVPLYNLLILILQGCSNKEVQRRMQLWAEVQMASSVGLWSWRWLQRDIHGLVPLPILLRLQMPQSA